MFISSKLAAETKNTYTKSNGMSPAEVIRCKLKNGCVYIKSSEEKYSKTTFSVKRETDVMQWLSGKLIVPRVIDFGFENNREFVVMSELKGMHIDDLKDDPEKYIAHLAKAVKLIQSVDISDCPFDSSVNVRLSELQYLMQNGLASFDDWEPETEFTDPDELYKWLCKNKPLREELFFSHGDLTANFFVDGSNYYFYDLGRAGIADKWLDIAFCIREIRAFGDKKLENKFFQLLNLEPDYEKIEYFMLLDEMF